jgi:hypothetical protein
MADHRILSAERELSWYFNVGLVRQSVSAIDVSAVSVARPGWEYKDPNLAIVTRCKPVREALKLCVPKVRKVLELAFTEQATRYSPLALAGLVSKEAARPKGDPFMERSELAVTFGERLGALVGHYRPDGSEALQRAWADATLKASMAAFIKVFNKEE